MGKGNLKPGRLSNAFSGALKSSGDDLRLGRGLPYRVLPLRSNKRRYFFGRFATPELGRDRYFLCSNRRALNGLNHPRENGPAIGITDRGLTGPFGVGHHAEDVAPGVADARDVLDGAVEIGLRP